MSTHTNNPAPHAGEKEVKQPQDGQTPGMAKPPADARQPSAKPSFSSTDDDPLATAGTGGSEDPKGKVRPGADVVPADSDEFDRRKERLDEADAPKESKNPASKPQGTTQDQIANFESEGQAQEPVEPATDDSTAVRPPAQQGDERSR